MTLCIHVAYIATHFHHTLTLSLSLSLLPASRRSLPSSQQQGDIRTPSPGGYRDHYSSREGYREDPYRYESPYYSPYNDQRQSGWCSVFSSYQLIGCWVMSMISCTFISVPHFLLPPLSPLSSSLILIHPTSTFIPSPPHRTSWTESCSVELLATTFKVNVFISLGRG